jgi:flagella basal body P-ring formation protein FlgA
MLIKFKNILCFLAIALWIPYSYAGVTVTTEPSQFVNLSIIDINKIKEIISESLKEKIKAENIAIDIKGYDEGIKINSKHDSYTVDIADSDFNTNSRRFKYSLSFKSGSDIQKIDIIGKYEDIVKVPVLVSKTEHGAAITKEDIDYIDSPKSKLQTNTIMDANDIIGKAIKHAMPAGKPIRSSDIEKQIIVSRGKTVTILYKTPSITLKASGLAMDSGAKGDVIRVRNSTSDKIIQAEIESNERVVVAAANK